MRWVRANGRFGAWLALAALALQFVVSFGHVHVDWFRHATAVALADASSDSSSPQPTPQPAGDPDAHCDICAVIHFTGNSFLPEPPRLPLPPVAHALEAFMPGATACVVSARSPFQSRAPPRA